jgi:hypothetical protein
MIGSAGTSLSRCLHSPIGSKDPMPCKSPPQGAICTGPNHRLSPIQVASMGEALLLGRPSRKGERNSESEMFAGCGPQEAEVLRRPLQVGATIRRGKATATDFRALPANQGVNRRHSLTRHRRKDHESDVTRSLSSLICSTVSGLLTYRKLSEQYSASRLTLPH